jgi:hypothetical protein
MHRSTVTDRSLISKSFIEHPWSKTTEDVAKFYDVNEEIGLSEERVRHDFERYGPNGNSTAIYNTL